MALASAAARRVRAQLSITSAKAARRGLRILGIRSITRDVHGLSVKLPLACFSYWRPLVDSAHWSHYEGELFDALLNRVRPGDTVVDVGAHLGLYALHLSRAVRDSGRVFALEPCPTTFSTLKETLRLNGATNVTPLALAIGHKSGTAQFWVFGADGSGSGLAPHSKNQRQITVETLTLDQFANQHQLAPDVIKIDTEGAELGVLRGAARSLDQARVLSIEFHPQKIPNFGEGTAEEALAHLERLGFTETCRYRQPRTRAEHLWPFNVVLERRPA